MTEHLTDQNLNSLRENRTLPDELVWIDDHLASCAECRSRIAASPESPAVLLGFTGSFTMADHLTYEQFEGYLDGDLAESERLLVSQHIDVCKDCAADISEMKGLVERPSDPIDQIVRHPGWLSFLFRPVPALAAAILLVSAIGVVWSLWSSGTLVADVPAPVIDAPATDPGPVPPDADPSPLPEAPKSAVLALAVRDGGRTVGISDDGELAGFDSLSPKYRGLVGVALKNGTVSTPDLGTLEGQPGVLMGDDGNTGTFRLLGPIGKILDTSTPALSWEAVPKAESYSVDIYDQDFNKVASSGDLRTNGWKPKLDRGRTYIWQVTAFAGDTVYRSPKRPAPDARFRLLDERTSSELAALKRANPRSHLAMGVAYANAGLIDLSIREFEQLARENPRNSQFQRILRQLRGQGR